MTSARMDSAENYQQTGVEGDLVTILNKGSLGTGNMEDLNRAIEAADMAVAVTPPNHPDRAAMLNTLGTLVGRRSERTGVMDDLNRAVEIADMAVAATPPHHPDRLGWLSNLGNKLGARFDRIGAIEDLNRAVEVANMAITIISPDHPDRARWLNALKILLDTRFKRVGAIEDLNRAVQIADVIMAITPSDHPERAAMLNSLGSRFGTRFERIGAMEDINYAVEVVNMAVAATPPDHPDRARRLTNLGNLLGMRFERAGAMEDLNRAVEVSDIAVAITPSDHPDRAAMLSNLGSGLGMRFERIGAMEDLNRAVEVSDIAVAITPSDHPDRARRLTNLGNKLGMRFERTGTMGDLNRAVEVANMAVAITPSDHPDRAAMLSNLGSGLGARFERIGAMGDLNRAVEVANMAVAATPPDHPDRARRLTNLGNKLGMRFERTAAMEDLNRAVDVLNMAVAITPSNHPNRVAMLTSLGRRLGARFERIGAMEDINYAVEIAEIAIATTPPDHPNRAGQLGTLGILLGIRFEKIGAMDDLNRAVEIANMAMTATPPDHPDRVIRLNNYGIMLGMRFRRIKAMDDLNRAVEIADMVAADTPPDHPDRAAMLSTLGLWLGERFSRNGVMDDVNRAVEVANMAVAATPPDHPDRATRLRCLGSWLGLRYTRTWAEADIIECILSFYRAWSCQNAQPSFRIRLAQDLANILTSLSIWDVSSEILQDAVKLLPTVNPRSLENTDKQHILGQFAGLASDAAAISLKAGKGPYHALELMELGRGVIAGLLLEMRTDISDLQQKYRKIAEDFASLRDELDSPINGATLSISDDNVPSLVSRVNRRREVGQKFDEAVARLRTLHGFENFLLMPTADELMAAADPGPIVVVNISIYRCDAFLIERHQIRSFELPNLSLKEVEKIKELGGITSSTLKWLWDVAARPILEALGFQKPICDDNWPHVWWILTGALSHIPLHAAGHHARGSTETVIDRVMSSYSLSVKALIYGRRHSVRKSAGSGLERALLVAMRKTPDLSLNSVLPFAEDEVAMLNGLCPSLQLDPVQPRRRKEDVLVHLRACKIFHFAGHGHIDPSDPSRSCLLLEDWKDNPLTVGDFRDHRLQENPPFLGYLSACSTGANKVDKLIDEGIHLVSACQLAGFRHVVGTLWEVSDRHCVDVAKVLYETLRDEGMTDVAVCRGLHKAVSLLRDGDNATRREMGEGRDAILLDDNSHAREQEKPLYWIPYIHFGV